MTAKRVSRLLFLASTMTMLVAPMGARATTGDFIGQVTFNQGCNSGLGTGIAFDGVNLWYSCYSSNPDLLRADPTTGNVTASYNITNGLGSIAFDATRNAIWGAPGGGSSNIYLISLDQDKDVASSTAAFSICSHLCSDLVDGLAYDGTDDTLYFSPDGSTTIHHYSTAGVHLTDGPNASGDFGWAGNSCYNSGLAIGGDLLFEGADGCSTVWVVSKSTPSTVVTSFSTQVAGDPNFRDEGLACDPLTFAAQGKQVMWSKEAYSPMRAHAYEIPTGSCGLGGLPSGGSQAYTVRGASADAGIDTGDVARASAGTGRSASTDIAVVDQIPNVLVRAGHNEVNASPLQDVATSSAESTVAEVSLAGGVIRARSIVSEANASFDRTSQSGTTSTKGDIAQLVVDGTPVDVGSDPNQVVVLPTGTLTVREVTVSTGTAYMSVQQTMLHYVSTDGKTDVSVASAFAAAGNGFSSPDTHDRVLPPVPPTPPVPGASPAQFVAHLRAGQSGFTPSLISSGGFFLTFAAASDNDVDGTAVAPPVPAPPGGIPSPPPTPNPPVTTTQTQTGCVSFQHAASNSLTGCGTLTITIDPVLRTGLIEGTVGGIEIHLTLSGGDLAFGANGTQLTTPMTVGDSAATSVNPDDPGATGFTAGFDATLVRPATISGTAKATFTTCDWFGNCTFTERTLTLTNQPGGRLAEYANGTIART